MTARDDSVAILHGSADNSLRWVWLSKKSGSMTIARVDRTGFFFREYGAPGGPDIARITAPALVLPACRGKPGRARHPPSGATEHAEHRTDPRGGCG